MTGQTFRTLIACIACMIALSGCSGSAAAPATSAAGASTVTVSGDPLLPATRLVFVVTPDLAHNGGDISSRTANLNARGLRRALMLGPHLRTLMNSTNPAATYALEPCTHLQTADSYPDMVPLEVVEQFALLNQFTLKQPPAPDLTAASFPVNVSYTPSSLPAVAATPYGYFPTCQGIDFADQAGGNEALVADIIARQQGGWYVLAMPFETCQSLLRSLKALRGYDYDVPADWQGPDVLYVLTLPAGATTATLVAHDTHLEPGDGFPTPSIAYVPAVNLQVPFVITTATESGSSRPSAVNTNETVYFVRHGEAHPTAAFENGNLVMQGGWRSLYLPGALAGKIKKPDYVYSVDPAAAGPGMNKSFYSYVRPCMTIAPYAIANDLPLQLASGFQCFGFNSAEDATQVDAAVRFFFTGGRFSNKTLVVAWEHDHIGYIGQALVNKYFADNPSSAPTVGPWSGPDYDTIWTFNLDSSGNLTLSNLTCEGIDSPTLPSTAPTF